MDKLPHEPTIDGEPRSAVAETGASDFISSLRLFEYRLAFLVLADLVAIAGTFLLFPLAVSIVPLGKVFPATNEIMTPNGFALLGTSILVMFYLVHLYRWKINQSTFDEIPVIAGASAAAILVVLMISKTPLFREPVLVEVGGLAWVSLLVFVPVARSVARGILGRVRAFGVGQKRTLIVGAGDVGRIMAEKFRRRADLGLRPIGFVDSSPPKAPEPDLPVLGGEEDLLNLVRIHKINHVILAFSPSSHDRLLRMIRRCDRVGVSFSVVPRLFEITYFSEQDEIEGVPLVNLRKSPAGKAERVTKRAIDLLLTSASLILLAPFFAVLSILIKIDSRGPVFFRQERVGRDSKKFTMLKFRSMVAEAESKKHRLNNLNEASGPLFKIKRDPRLTRVGLWLRKFSLDELPQLFNVFKGEMSLVGPRPALPEEVKQYSGWHKRRLAAMPGVTGLWQVLGRSDLSFEEMVKLDYLYLRNYSLRLDLRILARTIPAVLSRRGAC